MNKKVELSSHNIAVLKVFQAEVARMSHETIEHSLKNPKGSNLYGPTTLALRNAHAFVTRLLKDAGEGIGHADN